MPYGKYESHSKYGSVLLPFICRRDVFTNSKKSFTPHWHENIEILRCIKGKGSVIIDGTVFDFKPDTTIIINPNQIHIVTSENSVEYDCIIIFNTFCKENGIDTNKYMFNPVIQDKKICNLHRKLYNDFQNQKSIIKIRIDALNLLLNLQEKFLAEISNTNATSVMGIKTAIEYINRNFQEIISLDEISGISNLSKYYFTKKFKEITGKTYTEFLNDIRCRKAADYLKTGKSVNEVCYDVGFNDPAYFSRVFKKAMGKCPSKYQQKA